MRKLWYAGAAVASGILLFAASPARADVLPGGTGPDSQAALLPGNSIAPPVGDLLSGAGGWAVTRGQAALSDAGRAAMTGAGTAAGQARNGLDRVRRPTNGIRMTVPLDGSRPLTRFKPGADSPDLASGLLPHRRSASDLPAADVVGGALPQPGRVGGGLLGGLLGGGLPLLPGLMPDGQQTFDRPDGQQAFDPRQRSTESFDGGLPLLGGLGGNLPANSLPQTLTGGTVPDVTGLPSGGMTVLAPASPVKPSAAATPAYTGSAPARPAPSAASAPPATPASPAAPAGTTASAATPYDPRLHEEPIDGEAGHRGFSPDGRPVAGVDQDYK